MSPWPLLTQTLRKDKEVWWIFLFVRNKIEVHCKCLQIFICKLYRQIPVQLCSQNLILKTLLCQTWLTLCPVHLWSWFIKFSSISVLSQAELSIQIKTQLNWDQNCIFFCWIKWTRRKVCYVWHSRVLSTAKPCGKRPHGKRTSLGRDFEIPKTY